MPEEPVFRVMYAEYCAARVLHRTAHGSYSLIPDTEEDTDRLQLSRPACALMLDTYGVNSRFPGMMRRQMQPSRMIDYDPETGEPRSIRASVTPRLCRSPKLCWDEQSL